MDNLMTMPKKIRIALLCGGKSAEHEISLLSAENVLLALDKTKYEVIVIGIDKKGKWFLHEKKQIHKQKKLFSLKHSGKQLGYVLDGSHNLSILNSTNQTLPVDVIIPILHGPYGEDGAVQGFFKLMNIPFIGAGVTGSSLGMDKDVMKRLLRDAGIPIANFLVFDYLQENDITFEQIQNVLDTPFFVKPANLGSSVGVTKVHKKSELQTALNLAFCYDTKILIEQEIKGREIECSVLGNHKIIASIPGEVIPHDEFYSYKAKYLDENGAELQIPAKLDKNTMKVIQNLAIKTAKVLCIQGMGRVDFFLTKENKLFVNEINTIPGFTNISMYPKLWQASGISNSQLLDKLICLALQRYAEEKELRTDVIKTI